MKRTTTTKVTTPTAPSENSQLPKYPTDDRDHPGNSSSDLSMILVKSGSMTRLIACSPPVTVQGPAKIVGRKSSPDLQTVLSDHPTSLLFAAPSPRQTAPEMMQRNRDARSRRQGRNLHTNDELPLLNSAYWTLPKILLSVPQLSRISYAWLLVKLERNRITEGIVPLRKTFVLPHMMTLGMLFCICSRGMPALYVPPS